MSELVSRQTFLNYLEGIDYHYFGNINADWDTINNECEKKVEEHPEYWCSLVPEESEFEAWDKNGENYIKHLQPGKEWGYHSRNTMSWETTSIKPKLEMSWEKDIVSQLPLYESVSRPTLQRPGNIMPWHDDKFFYFKHEYPDEYDYTIRFIVFHNDWEIGHIIQAGDSYIPHWKQGDVITWFPRRWHLAANIGMLDKWTTNITGVLREEVNSVI